MIPARWLAGCLSILQVTATAVTADPVEDVLALEPDLENGRFIYQLCADCHTPQGWGLPDGSIPVISGQHRSVLIKQLADIRDGFRGNESMVPFAKDEAIGGDQAIADVTEYISRLLMPSSPATGPGDKLEAGADHYRQHCASCHGLSGEGDPARRYPRVQGQHYPYLVSQIDHMLTGERRNADPAMVAVLSQLAPEHREAIADFLSRVEPDDRLVAPEGWENPDFNYGIQ